MDDMPASGAVDEKGQREDEGDGGEYADQDIHVRDGRHASDSGEDDDEGGNDVDSGGGISRDHGGKHHSQDVAAADELIAGDGGVGEEHRDDAEHAGELV